MKVLSSFLGALSLLAVTTSVAGEFSTRVIASGLNRPTGIVAGDEELYFTEVPNPATPNAGNGVKRLDLDDGTVTVVNTGEPEPVNLAMDRHGQIYWTCKTAGVILERNKHGEIGVLLDGLNHPVGIALNRQGDRLYWTEVPTPGVGGASGGQNKVWELNLRTMKKTLVDAGDPEPTDIAVGHDGDIYWTCTSAGVIVEASRERRRH